MNTSDRIIVIGASAGGLVALETLLLGLPRETPAAVFVVIHFPPRVESHLPEILNRLGSVPATHATDGARIESRRLYAAPPGDRHLWIEPGVMHLIEGPFEMRARPSADALFRSAAAAYGDRVIGVVLSGMDGDGALGIEHVKRGGGLTIAQDPDEARHAGMPETALAGGYVDYCATAAQIGPLLARLARVGLTPPREAA